MTRLKVQRDGDEVRLLVGDDSGTWLNLQPEEALQRSEDIEELAESIIEEQSETDDEPESDFAGNPDENQTRFGRFAGGGDDLQSLYDRVDDPDRDPVQPGENLNPTSASKW